MHTNAARQRGAGYKSAGPEHDARPAKQLVGMQHLKPVYAITADILGRGIMMRDDCIMTVIVNVNPAANPPTPFSCA